MNNPWINYHGLWNKPQCSSIICISVDIAQWTLAKIKNFCLKIFPRCKIIMWGLHWAQLWSLVLLAQIGFISIFEIFPWAFQQYMTWPYLMNTHFCLFLGLRSILGRGGSGWVGSFFFLSYWNLLFMGFPMVYDTILNGSHFWSF